MADWALLAACRGVNPDVFFPETRRTRRENPEAYQEARQMCDRCPVRVDCLAECLRREAIMGGRWGMWGGTTPYERYELVRLGRLVRRVA